MTPAAQGLMLGLLLAAGLLLVLRALTSGPRRRGGDPPRSRWNDLLVEAGLPTLTPARLWLACLASGLLGLVVVLTVSQSMAIAVVLGGVAATAPLMLVRRRQRQRQEQLRGLWPDVIDNLASAVRAGLSLPEALEQIGVSGPDALRGPFRHFAEDYRVSGRFGESLDRLKAELADPVGDRVVEALRVAREVGGSDLGRVLRTLAAFLRDDARTRGELESRQSWTVNAARLAVAAPWVLLLLLSTRPQAVAAYDSTAGLVVLGFGAVVSVVAYRLMLRIGRLPRESRVLR